MSFRRLQCALLLALITPLLRAGPAPADEVPSWLPRYDLDIKLEIDQHVAHVRQRVTWTNRHQRPAEELVFNVHSHYKIPDGDVGLLAKTLEIMRMAPEEGLDTVGRAMEVDKVSLGDQKLEVHYQDDNATALVVSLPRAVEQGESVIIDVDCTMRLPQKQGRWGQWDGVTYLSNWLPVLAFYDEKGWQPTPFIPWHQPFFNESGVYNARVVLPADQKIACTGTIQETRELPGGLKQVHILANGMRDFAFICCARFQEVTAQAGPVRIHCLHLPEHEHYAHKFVEIACEVIPIYSQWFGPYPFADFTVAESYFGWNGNECAGLVMIDARVFDMPHLASGYVEYLLSHEICHQWWYNVVGTNGYCETWMDEGLATYFSHRFLNQKCGRNNELMRYPRGLEWLPNIRRENYRLFGLYGTIGRGETGPTVQEMPKFSHVFNLFSMCYDKGAKIVGMIEDRLGEAAFLDFMRLIYTRYQYRILRVADFQAELEAYTGRSWDEFFRNWLYGAGLSDWSVENVEVTGQGPLERLQDQLAPLTQHSARSTQHSIPTKVTVLLHQKAEINEETVLGFRLDDSNAYQIRIPILPQAGVVELEDPPARIEMLPDNRVRVEVTLPCKPTQIAVDPDQLLVDRNPANNFWKTPVRWRFTPLYTLMEESDLTNDYDRWNVTIGPWLYGASYDDPWYTRSPIIGARAGLYRMQTFTGGAYLGYRTDERDIAAGVDALWDHFPWVHTQIGFNIERSLTGLGSGATDSGRGVVFGRYVFQYHDSLYLPPMHHVEAFAAVQNEPLPFPANMIPGAVRLNEQTTLGLHYHLDYLTPYWDPEGGIRFDAVYAEGVPLFGEHEAYHAVSAQFSTVKSLPDLSGWVEKSPGLNKVAGAPLRWLADTRLAGRLYGAGGLPDKGEYFTLGGSELFRGFDLAQRQGNAVWVASLEWRVPLVKGLGWSCCDQVCTLRNIYGAAFYDVGDAYVNGHSYGPVAHAVGGGLRLDVSWFQFIERTMLRFDVAKTVNADTPVQFWFGVHVPF